MAKKLTCNSQKKGKCYQAYKKYLTSPVITEMKFKTIN